LNQEAQMKKVLPLLLPVGMVLLLVTSLNAKDLEAKGKEWLDTHSGAPAINVTGNWHEKSWGTVVLHQAPDGRDVTGDGDGWDITGVVSGKQVFLLFSHKGKVNYSAQLTSEGDSSLNGSYEKGFMRDGAKGRSMHLTKQ
jgi:hypothetical protein